MQLFVQGQALHTLTVSEEASVGQLKAILAGLEGVPADDQVLTYGGSPLEENSMLLGVLPDLTTLTLTARLVGGELNGGSYKFVQNIKWHASSLRKGAWFSSPCWQSEGPDTKGEAKGGRGLLPFSLMVCLQY